jgi:hypothetical protein
VAKWSLQMELRRLILALGGLAALVTASSAEDAAPTAYACTFEKGNSWSFDGGAYKSITPAPLAFEIVAIDLEKQSADLAIDGKPAGKLRIVRALNANSFLEVVDEGFLNLTTVYDADAATGTHPAVHSRHFGVIGQPVFAQYAGTCKGK